MLLLGLDSGGGLRIRSFQERHGRLLKLIGGAVMLALGVVLLAAPQLMEGVVPPTIIVVGSILVALVIDWVYRRLRERGGASPA